MDNNVMIIGQLLITASNILGLEAAKAQNQGIKIALHTAENLTKLLAFSDLDSSLTKSYSVLGAFGLTAILALDDIAINQGLYESHHLGKVGCAIYAGLKCSSYISKTDTAATISEAAIWSGALLAGSYLFGSGDMINVMRSNTSDSVEFADEVYETSNGKVNIHKDMIAGSLIGGVLSGGRKFLPKELDIGNAPLNGIISATTSTAVHIISSSNSEKNFKNILVDKFQNKLRYISVEQINKLDYRAQKILEKLPEYIEKASHCITINATNTGVKTAYQNTLASSKFNNQDINVGFDVFVIANLFNWASADNLAARIAKNIKSMQEDGNFSKLSQDYKMYEIRKTLNVLKDKKSDSVTTKLLNFAKIAVKLAAPAFIGSILLKEIYKSAEGLSIKDTSAPLGSILSIGETFVDVDAFTAIKQLQYLENALEQVNHYSYESLDNNDIYNIGYTQTPETYHEYD